MKPTEAASGATGHPQPRDWTWSSIYGLGFLTLISTFNYLDRAILGLALPAIKLEMAVSDTVLGLVSGLAFVLFYSILGIPIAWAADRWNRRNIIALGFGFWSLMTALTGFISSIWQLAAARFLMGAGEACGLAPSNSMLSDMFRPERRALVLSIFGTASSIAFIFFFPLAGWIAEHWGWRSMFMAAGVPGIFLALLFAFTVREPVRGARESQPRSLLPIGFSETIRFLAGSRAYLAMIAGAMLMGANLFAASTWTPTFLARVHDMSMGEVASSIGPIRGLLGAAGIVAGGLLLDRFGRHNDKLRVRLPAVACLLAAPAEILFLLADGYAWWMLGFALSSFFTLIHQGPIFSAAIHVAKLRMRAVAIAILVFAASLLGQAVGPLFVGVLTDLLEPRFGDLAIRYSMLIIVFTAVAAAAMFWIAGNWVDQDHRRAAEE
ncbi:MFS transporter [Sphingosinicella sp. CPCC 101087]|uniref:spinster family MFS transporter n=1 Tax=Sphingosinicella sp. CPCC 101087 TaxID=2497754 RepID=UPI00101DD1F5|nr:MFS transporter [Sphingosinicella sp. CPCC 101087]